MAKSITWNKTGAAEDTNAFMASSGKSPSNSEEEEEEEEEEAHGRSQPHPQVPPVEMQNAIAADSMNDKTETTLTTDANPKLELD